MTLRVRTAHGPVCLEVRDKRIVAVALADEPGRALPDELSRLSGAYVGPAFSDAHIHLLGFARALTTPDLGPVNCPTISALLDRIAALRGATRSSGWIVLRGFDDALVLERRFPTRAELDRVTGDVPLRLRHRTGHASVLNSAAFRRIASLPRSATIDVDRDLEPIAVIGAEDWLNAIVGRPPDDALFAGLREAEDYLRRRSIVRIWDATPRTADGIDELKALIAVASFEIDVRAMAAAECLREPRELPAAVVKLFPGELEDGLVDAIATAHARGACVAIHCTALSELDAALAALERSGPSRGDRLEHATLCTPTQAERIARLGLVVVVNPGWLTERGAKYAEQIPAEDQRWLVPLRTMISAGCELAFGSDAPVAAPAPREWIDVVTRRPGTQSISISAALEAARGDAIWRDETSTSSFIVTDRDFLSIAATVLATCIRGHLTLLR